MLTYSRRHFCALGLGTGIAAWTPYGRAERDLQTAPSGSATYRNPIIPGDHPDPSPLRVGSDFYITHSSFHYTPGLIIWHSRDLVHWTPVASALKQYLGDVWAPYLTEHLGHFFIYFPVEGNLFVVHASSPTGPWSEPIDLHLKGIDPCHLATPDGRRYLYVASGNVVELAADGLSATGKYRHVFDPWPIPDAWRVQCECLEAPKVTLKDGYIYLTVAEGGTSGPPTSHMVISMRSRNVDGPWELSPYNPILHTANKDQYWWSVGHGRLVQAVDGSWWMTCHAYRNSYRTLGRQNLLVPVEWTPDGWYRVTADVYSNPSLPAPPGENIAPRYDPSDSFAERELGLQWQFWKGYDAERIRLENGTLRLTANGTSPTDSSLMTSIATDTSYTAEIDVEIEPGCQAGLLLFYSSEHSVGMTLTTTGLNFVRNGVTRSLNVPATRAVLRIVNEEQEVDCYFKLPGKPWSHVRSSVDVVSYNENILKGFLDLRPAVLSCGSAHATFRTFRYIPRAEHPLA